MKTNKELLNELPEPIRTEAILNTPADVLELHNTDVHWAILSCFNWYKSSQGHDYWESIYEEQKLLDEMNQFDDNHIEEQQWEAEQENNNKSQFED